MREKILVVVKAGLGREKTELAQKIVNGAMASYSDATLLRFRNLGWIKISDETLDLVRAKRHQLLSNPPAVLGRKGF